MAGRVLGLAARHLSEWALDLSLGGGGNRGREALSVKQPVLQ